MKTKRDYTKMQNNEFWEKNAELYCHGQIARAVSTGPAKLAKFGAA